MIKKILFASIIIVFLAIDWLEFHDLLEPKTLPEYMTGIVSIPIIVVMMMEILKGGVRNGR